MGGFSRCVPDANRCVPRCVSVRSLKRIDVFLGADWCGYWGGIIKREARKHYAECILRNNLRSANDINFREMSDPEAIREYEELALSESELKELYDCQSISRTTISDKEYTLETLCCFSKNQLINRVKGLRTSSSLRGYSKEEVLQAIEHYDDPQYCKMREYLEKYL